MSNSNEKSWMPNDVEWQKIGEFCVNGKYPLEIAQGKLGDCYFLASLVSASWVNPQILNSVDKNGYHTITLYSLSGRAQRVLVDEVLPVDKNGRCLVYAHSTDPRTNGKIETWPAIWEKAYAIFHTNCKNNRPNMKKIDGGIGGTGLRVVTGKTPSYFYCNSKVDKEWKRLCNLTNGKGKTIKPVVVSTGLREKKLAPCGVVCDHVYSILGIETVGNVRRVILRNPWGYAYRDEATKTPKDKPQFCRDGEWMGIKLNENGIFSMQLDKFLDLFWTIYYV